MGKTAASYAVVPPNFQLAFSILRRSKGSKAVFTVQLNNLADEDFAQLTWAPDSLNMDISFGRNLVDFQLVVPETERGQRNLTCLLTKPLPYP